ncbi:hypothetical protein HCG49_11735 [Arenibacter sp. 6A1]|uniref:hypothetical protein n=1 Tax=Arenibacter sp. 6A1 TaxID=2720391 RepID=UPI001447E0A4|nr:hypothetical protein [Arenibacter sp. 6A1]NKI27234.1 hypothetical protein [Arenibacter sp. 6A1]
MMSKQIQTFTVLLLLLTSSLGYSQIKHDWDKIKSLKIAFITERLELNSKEAQEFWPIYNSYESEKEAFHKKEHSEIKDKIKILDQLSNKEANALLDKMVKLEDEKHKSSKAYIEKVSKTISSKKTILLLRSEEEFKRQLIKQYRQRKANQKK